MSTSDDPPMHTTMKPKDAGSRTRNLAGLALAGGLILVTIVVLAWYFWPEKKADLSQAFYTDDDGQTWFADSAFRVPPFMHNGKEAVVAHVYSYANGSRQMCGYLARFTADGRRRLEASIADAQKAGQPPGAAALYRDHKFMTESVEVKKPGPGHEWVPYNDPRALQVFAIHAPDGSVVDEVFVY